MFIFYKETVCLQVLFLLMMAFCLSGCVRNTIDDSIPEEIEGLVVPANFNWSNIDNSQLTVIPFDMYNGSYYYLIEVFDGNPASDTSSVLLAQGVATKNQYFIADLTLPALTSVIYVRQTDPLKLETVQSVLVDSSILICDFMDTTSVQASISSDLVSVLRSTNAVLANETPSGAIQLTSNLTSSKTLNANTAYVIPSGYIFTGKITFSQGSSLYIEGSLSVSPENIPSLAANTKLIIQNKGSLTVSGNGTLQAYDCDMYNYGSVEIKAISLTSTATLYNSGILSLSGQYSVTNNENVLINDGLITFGSVGLTNGSIENNGVMTVEGLFYVNGGDVTNSNYLLAQNVTATGSIFMVNCGFYVSGTLLDNSGSAFYIKTGSILKTTTLNFNGSKVYMEAESMLEAETAVFNSNSSYIYGKGSTYSLASFGSVVPGNGSYKCIYYRGRLEVECSDHYQGANKWNPFYDVNSYVRFSETGSATTEIEAGSCIGQGNTVTSPETIPSNPVFPIEVPASSVYTFVMEDNWPAIADYDMNDLVVNLSFKYTQNSANKVTGMTIYYTLRAVGAKKSIAAALQLDEIVPTQINQITYTLSSMLTGSIFPREASGYESGQSKVVIPLFDDAHRVLNPDSKINTMLNTYIDAQNYTPKSNSVSVEFKQAVDPSAINIMKMNYFIVPDGVAGATQRTEIHLSGFVPTDKVDGSRFGKYYDNSVDGAWYTTPGNLVWGILVPVNFDYSAETKSIVESYPDFAGWCTSGGVNNTYWYLNPTSESGFIY